jgi:hypothetical protein
MTFHPDDPRDDLELLDPAVEEELMLALRMATHPTELDARINEQLIAAAFEDPFAPPTDEEVAASERLRDALAGDPPSPDARLAAALAATSDPRELNDDHLEALVEQALSTERPRSNVIYVFFGGAIAITAAAAAALLFVSPVEPRAPAPADAFVSSRTTTNLFAERFKTEATTERMDRIATARQRDLRRNRYLAWGVK